MTEWDAGAYARISGLQAAMAAEVLALLQFEGDEQVLDVGCGNGAITSQIATRVPRGSVTGVDPSREMIAYATGHFGPDAFLNLRFDLCDARTLPFQDAFDRVVSFNALHWVPDQDAALRSIRRALKATGRAQLRLVVDGERTSVETSVEQTRKSPRWAQYFAEFRDPYLHVAPAQYAAAAERNGLRVVERRVQDKGWDFGTPVAFHAFCAVGCVAWTERLPDAMRDAFIDDALDRYRRAIGARPGEDGVFRFYQMDVMLERDKTRAP
ncbi:MAG: class I SAM-dependent methyltransferase [Casimicrobiaceae bacterium]